MSRRRKQKTTKRCKWKSVSNARIWCVRWKIQTTGICAAVKRLLKNLTNIKKSVAEKRRFFLACPKTILLVVAFFNDHSRHGFAQVNFPGRIVAQVRHLDAVGGALGNLAAFALRVGYLKSEGFVAFQTFERPAVFQNICRQVFFKF